MSSATSASRRHFRGRLARTLLIILLLLSMGPLLLLGGVNYARTRSLLRDQVFDLIRKVAEVQGQRLVSDMNTGQLLLTRSLANPRFTDDVDKALALPIPGGRSAELYRATIFNELQKINQPAPFYNQFLVLRNDGIIQYASRPEWEGKTLAFFVNKSTEAGTVWPETGLSIGMTNEEIGIYPAVTEQEGEPYLFITAVPYINRDGIRAATVVGIAESPVMQSSIQKAVFYTSNHYLVTRQGNFVGLNPYPNSFNKLIPLQTPGNFKQTITDGLATGAQRGVVETTSFDNLPVIAAYAWMPELQAGWVAEISQAQVYNQLNALLIFTIVLFVVIFVLMGAGILLITRQFTRPLLQLASTVNQFSEGSWEQRAPVTRNDELGLLSFSFNQMADELSDLYQSLEAKVQERTERIRTLSEISQVAISATSLDDLLERTVKLVVDQYDFAYAGIYLVDEPHQAGSATLIANHAILRKAAGSPEIERSFPGRRVRVEPGNLVGWVIFYNRSRTNHLSGNEFSLQGREDIVPSAKVEAAVPVAVGNQVLGTLHVQTIQANVFDTVTGPGLKEKDAAEDLLSELQTLANQIASSIQNFRLLEATQINLQETERLYRASSQIAQAETVAQVLSIAQQALVQLPFVSAILIADGTGLSVYETRLESRTGEDGDLSTGRFKHITVPHEQLESSFMQTIARQEGISAEARATGPVIRTDFNPNSRRREAYIPAALLDWARQLECDAVAFLPASRGGKLASLLVLGSHSRSTPGTKGMGAQPFTLSSLAPYNNLIELVTTTLEKVTASQTTQKNLAELRTLASISQAMSIETNLTSLYRVIHKHILQIMGEDVSFYIALYDPRTDFIEIPYNAELEGMVPVQPFPLGTGLTSILIRTCKPLMLVENTEAKSRALGAISTGKSAKSWLGVPLLLSGEAIGAIVVQDTEQERRFNEDHQRLLTTIASQVAVVVRNARLLEEAQSRAAQDRLITSVTGKVWTATEMDDILSTALHELGQSLRASEGEIELSVALIDQAQRTAAV